MGKVNETVDRVTARTNMPRETVFHLLCGLAAVLLMLVVVGLAKMSLGVAVMVFAVVFGVGVEWYQQVRTSTPGRWIDALKAAGPGLVFGVALLVLKIAAISLPSMAGVPILGSVLP